MRCTGLLAAVVVVGATLATPVGVVAQTRGGGGPPDGGAQADPLATDPMLEWRRQWWAAMEFIRTYSPQRAAEYESLPRRNPDRGQVRGSLMSRYRALQALKEQNAELYELGVQRLSLEDQAWGLGRQIRQASTEQDKQALAESLEPVVRQLVENHFAEREYRIERLREALAREEQRLSEARVQTDAVVRRQMERIIRDETFLLAGPGEEDNGGMNGETDGPPEEMRGGDGARQRRAAAERQADRPSDGWGERRGEGRGEPRGEMRGESRGEPRGEMRGEGRGRGEGEGQEGRVRRGAGRGGDRPRDDGGAGE